MTLAAGTKVGPYEIQSAIGAGEGLGKYFQGNIAPQLGIGGRAHDDA
jgi:hypothetical protein